MGGMMPPMMPGVPPGKTLRAHSASLAKFVFYL